MNRKNHTSRFAVCVNNKGYEVSLEPRKIYRVLRDVSAAKHGYIRVIDETGEDYLFPAARFLPIALPRSAQKALKLAR
ncbi:MAG: hypothetical protein ACRD5W_15170 [Candidatus Acidiferrales bacterium]